MTVTHVEIDPRNDTGTRVYYAGGGGGHIVTPSVTYVYMNGFPAQFRPLCKRCGCCVWETRGHADGDGVCSGHCDYPEGAGHPLLSAWQCRECGFWAGPEFHPSNVCDRYPLCRGLLAGPHDPPGPQGHFTELRPGVAVSEGPSLALPF